jgi:hypothetical protein
MRKWMSVPVMVAGLACNNPTEGNAFTVGNLTTGLAETSSEGSDTGTGDASEDGSTTTSGSGESTSSAAASSSSSGGSTGGGAQCGNGVVEDGEQCDDADDDEFDDCTSECAVPRCNDRAHNGDETDLDCGGSCQGCPLCLACADDDDCDGAMICGDADKCIVHARMSVDWLANCGGVIDGAVVEDLPAGTYLASAVMSAGTLWLPATHNPPSSGWFYETQCNAGVDLDLLATPAGVRYATIAEVYPNLISNVQEFDFIGGDLVCYRTDGTCGDNSGVVEFDLDYVCAEMP